MVRFRWIQSIQYHTIHFILYHITSFSGQTHIMPWLHHLADNLYKPLKISRSRKIELVLPELHAIHFPSGHYIAYKSVLFDYCQCRPYIISTHSAYHIMQPHLVPCTANHDANKYGITYQTLGSLTSSTIPSTPFTNSLTAIPNFQSLCPPPIQTNEGRTLVILLQITTGMDVCCNIPKGETPLCPYPVSCSDISSGAKRKSEK